MRGPALIGAFVMLVGVTGAAVAGVPVEDVASAAGTAFRHADFHGPQMSFHESTAGGACWGDYDRDGRLDLFVTDFLDADGNGGSALYRNLGPDDAGTWRFEDVAAGVGARLTGVGQGCAWGDHDNDGYPDLYVTFAVTGYSAQGNVLLRNVGGERFEDVTAAAGVDGRGDPACAPDVHVGGVERPACWSTGVAWLDHDQDGDLDLYVGQYAEFPRGACVHAYRGNPVFCQGQVNRLYRNEANGSFTEVAALAGVQCNHQNTCGRTLGVLATDVNGDAWPDLWVANDKDANALYVNNRDGTFTDRAADWGATAFGTDPLGENAEEHAGMGVAAGDFDGDGRPDLVSTHLQGELDALLSWRDGAFADVALEAGVGEEVALDVSRWGVGFPDVDLDGDVDLVVVAGGQQPASRGPVHLLLNEDGRFTWQPESAWPFIESARANHRQAAFADYDNDGDADVLVTVLPAWDEPEHVTKLLAIGTRAPGSADGPAFLRVTLEGTDAARDAVGARVTLHPEGDGAVQHRWVVSGGSYLGNDDPRLLFGLGSATAGSVTVTWPGGAEQGPVPFEVDPATGGAELVIVQENRLPPAPVQWVRPPEPGPDGVVLQWTPSFAADFAAYRVSGASPDGASSFSQEIRDRHETRFPAPSAREGWDLQLVVLDSAGHASAPAGAAAAEDAGRAFLPAPSAPLALAATALALALARRARG